ncbi:hypothetical protein O9992_07805 [Vibrio lentus]|nr:hypothetical protein [Vibrio lentus]
MGLCQIRDNASIGVGFVCVLLDRFSVAVVVLSTFFAHKCAMEAVQSLPIINCADRKLKQIKETSVSIEGVLGVHRLRTRRSRTRSLYPAAFKLEDNIPRRRIRISDGKETKLISVCVHGYFHCIQFHQDPYSVVFGPEAAEISFLASGKSGL